MSITRKQALAVADVFDMLARLYDDHVLDKVTVKVKTGNNVVIE